MKRWWRQQQHATSIFCSGALEFITVNEENISIKVDSGWQQKRGRSSMEAAMAGHKHAHTSTHTNNTKYDWNSENTFAAASPSAHEHSVILHRSATVTPVIWWQRTVMIGSFDHCGCLCVCVCGGGVQWADRRCWRSQHSPRLHQKPAQVSRNQQQGGDRGSSIKTEGGRSSSAPPSSSSVPLLFSSHWSSNWCGI